MARTSPAAEDLWLLPTGDANAEALASIVEGQRDLDMGRAVAAYEAFGRAIAADPSSAYAQFGAANASPSLETFLSHLAQAEALAAQSTDAVRALVRIARLGLTNDTQGQLDQALALTRLEPGNPRAWMQLANVQSARNDEVAARASLERAIAAAGDFAPAHMQLLNSYLLLEPRDLARAEAHAERAVELEPEEATTHDLLGDVYRAQDKLEEAAAQYTAAVELGSENGLGYQQRGHVRSFLGKYDEARADYDAAIAEADPNAATTYAVYRALVPVHAGQPAAALDELDALVARIDRMDVPNAVGNKLFALATESQIAAHHGLLDRARSANERWAALARRQAEEIGTAENTAATEAQIAVNDGTVAARAGDYETARAKAREAIRRVEGQRNPVREQNAHELLGLAALLEGDYATAVAEYRQTSPNNLYASYHYALALDGLGRTEEAREIFARVASNNFNGPGLALVKRDARARAEAS